MKSKKYCKISLYHSEIPGIEFDENGVTKREKIFPGIGRVRDVNLGPDGYVYISVEAIGIFRVLPK